MKRNSHLAVLVVQILIAVLTISGVAIAGPLIAAQSTGGAPTVVSYQGRVSISGTPYSGSGYFKFAVVDAAGTTSYWSNDGTSSGGSEPTSAVILTVGNGLFTVLLGDTTLANMTRPLTAAAFRSPQRALRVWFSSNNVTFTQLTPDTRLASVPYALQAEESHNADYSYYPLMQAQSLNLTSVNANLKGFMGGFSDGKYAYFVPNSTEGGPSGLLARVDVNNFTTGGVTTLNLAGIADLSGFIGGFTDGRYGYFVPNFTNGTYSGKIGRVDLQNFAPGGMSSLELTSVDSALKGFVGGFTDGRYGYFVPYYNGDYSGKVARVDLQNFTPGGVTILNLAGADPSLRGFQGGFTDGRYGYFIPFYNGGFSGKVARVDLQNFNAGGVSSLDLTAYDSGLKGFIGGFTDGRYGYLVPYNNDAEGFSGKIGRFDLQNFTASGVSMLDLKQIDSTLNGYTWGFTDGRYGYFLPNYNGNYHGKLVRIDLQDFTVSGVTWIDLAALDSGLAGFSGGFTDGRFGYLAPNSNNGGFSGKIARIQLLSGTTGP